MTILNLMLGKKRGGLEQAAIDYAEAMALGNIPCLTVISPAAWVEASLVAANLAHESLVNFSGWDYLAALRLRRLAKRTGATAVLCHGNRALKLALWALKGRIPVIVVAHNYALGRFARADHGIAITRHLEGELKALGMATISVVPNMVRLPLTTRRSAYRTPPVIGTMGRLVPKKGFPVFIDALALLAQRGVSFSAVLGGDGEDMEMLRDRVAQYGLTDRVTFTGWVKDKTAFFESLDVFVLPSNMEAFGIVLIEAMAHKMPIVTTDAEGPREIVQVGGDAIMVPRRDVTAMADGIEQLLRDPARAAQLAEAADAHVRREYTAQAMAERLQRALAPYLRSQGASHG